MSFFFEISRFEKLQGPWIKDTKLHVALQQPEQDNLQAVSLAITYWFPENIKS